MNPELNYKEAFAALQKLVEEIEDETIPLDQLAEKVKEAHAYIHLCEEKLRSIEAEVEKAGGPAD